MSSNAYINIAPHPVITPPAPVWHDHWPTLPFTRPALYGVTRCRGHWPPAGGRTWRLCSLAWSVAVGPGWPGPGRAASRVPSTSRPALAASRRADQTTAAVSNDQTHNNRRGVKRPNTQQQKEGCQTTKHTTTGGVLNDQTHNNNRRGNKRQNTQQKQEGC